MFRCHIYHQLFCEYQKYSLGPKMQNWPYYFYGLFYILGFLGHSCIQDLPLNEKPWVVVNYKHKNTLGGEDSQQASGFIFCW